MRSPPNWLLRDSSRLRSLGERGMIGLIVCLSLPLPQGHAEIDPSTAHPDTEHKENSAPSLQPASKTNSGEEVSRLSDARTSPPDLTKFTLVELMEMPVTSVSKRPEPFFDAPAALHVITSEEIRRS